MTHTVTVHWQNGPLRKSQARCAICGPLNDWTTDHKWTTYFEKRRHEGATK